MVGITKNWSWCRLQRCPVLILFTISIAFRRFSSTCYKHQSLLLQAGMADSLLHTQSWIWGEGIHPLWFLETCITISTKISLHWSFCGFPQSPKKLSYFTATNNLSSKKIGACKEMGGWLSYTICDWLMGCLRVSGPALFNATIICV